MRKACLALTALMLSFPFAQAAASEGATGVYFPGTYNDFMVAVIPGPGFYLRNDAIYYQGSLDLGIFSGLVRTDATLSVFTDILKPAYFTDWKMLGGRYGFGANIPYVDTELRSLTTVAGLTFRKKESASGLSDIAFIPAMLDWDLAHHQLFLLLYENIYTPTGEFKKTSAINQGHGYYAFDTDLAATWLSADAMRELSLTLGYIINTENTLIQYKTGHEMHLDFLLGQHLTKNFELGATGYVYDQLTGDSGKGAVLGAFEGFAWGAGPALSYSISAGKTHVIDIISKYIHEFDTQKRFQGNEVDLAISGNV